MILNILSWCVFGLIVGAIARFLVPGRDPMGCLGTIALGIVGALLGGFVASMITGRPLRDEFNAIGFLGALIGGIIVLLLVRQFRPRRRL